MKINIIILILVFILTAGISNSQVLNYPDSYILSSKSFSPVIHSVKDLPPVTAVPVRTKYPISNFITDILLSGDTVWFATGNGIMRTTDRFNTFENYFGVQPFGNDDVSGFTFLKNVFVVSTAISKEIGGEFIPTGTGIKVSTDYGVSWNSFPQPIDGKFDTSIVYGSNSLYALPVIVPEQNLSYDIAITQDTVSGVHTIWITSFAGGLRKSTDYGNTWQRVLLPPDNLDSIYIGGTGYNFALNPRNNLNHRAFTVEAFDNNTLFVGTANGINVSTDAGVSWRKFTYQNSGSGVNRVSGNFVVNFHIQKFANKKIIWAATRRAEDNNEVNALSYSTNNGRNWAYTLDGYSPNNISSKDSVVYGQTDGGLWRSYFGRFDWTRPSLIYDPVSKDIVKTNNFYSGNHINDTLYFGSNDGLLRTIENGTPWTAPWKIFRAIQSIDLNSDTKTYAAPNPFSPATEFTRFFFKSKKSPSKVTIKIFDFSMAYVATVIQNATRSGTDELFAIWDGKKENGTRVANGVYFYRIEIEGEDTIWGKVLVMQ